MRPEEALDKAIEYSAVDSMRRRPGELIARLPRDMREALARLTSDAALNMRPDWIKKS